MVDVSDVRGLLRAYDGCLAQPVPNAVAMLRRVTQAISKDPAKYELLDPDDCEAWREAGGESYCSNVDFPSKVCSRWRELLSRPDWARANLDKDELEDLKDSLQRYFKKLSEAEFELDVEELMAELDDAIAAAPEAEDEDEDDSDED